MAELPTPKNKIIIIGSEDFNIIIHKNKKRFLNIQWPILS